MNTQIYKKLRLCFGGMALFAVLGLLSSCEKYDDLPPIKKNESASKIYKLPEPKGMTAEDKAKEQEIKKEYDNAKK